MSYVTIIPGTPPVEAVPDRYIDHVYDVGDTIEATGATIEAVAFGNPNGLSVEMACYHYAHGGWDYVEGIDRVYPKPAPKPVTTTTIVIEQYAADGPMYGQTADVVQRAVAASFKGRMLEGERWVITTTTDADIARLVKPVEVMLDYPERDTV